MKAMLPLSILLVAFFAAVTPAIDWAIDTILAFLSWDWAPVITFCAAVVAVAVLTTKNKTTRNP